MAPGTWTVSFVLLCANAFAGDGASPGHVASMAERLARIEDEARPLIARGDAILLELEALRRDVEKAGEAEPFKSREKDIMARLKAVRNDVENLRGEHKALAKRWQMEQALAAFSMLKGGRPRDDSAALVTRAFSGVDLSEEFLDFRRRVDGAGSEYRLLSGRLREASERRRRLRLWGGLAAAGALAGIAAIVRAARVRAAA